MAVFAEGQLLHTAQLPVGGVHVTNDIARILSTPVGACGTAEDAVRQRAAEPGRRARNAAGAAGGRGRAPDRQGAAQHGGEHHPAAPGRNLRDGARSGWTARDSARVAGTRVVLTGGASQLSGAREMAARDPRAGQVRLGHGRRSLRDLPDSACGPAFATAVGLLAWAAGEGRALHDIDLETERPGGWVAPHRQFSAGACVMQTRIVNMFLQAYPSRGERCHDPEPDNPAEPAHRLHAADHRDRRWRRRHQCRRQHDRDEPAGRGVRCRQHRCAAVAALAGEPPHPARPAHHAGPRRRGEARDRPRRGRGGGGRAVSPPRRRAHGVHHRRHGRRHRHRRGAGDRAHGTREEHPDRRRGDQAVHLRGPAPRPRRR